jgi:hypothetical protein
MSLQGDTRKAWVLCVDCNEQQKGDPSKLSCLLFFVTAASCAVSPSADDLLRLVCQVSSIHTRGIYIPFPETIPALPVQRLQELLVQ